MSLNLRKDFILIMITNVVLDPLPVENVSEVFYAIVAILVWEILKTAQKT
jgi:hypothetical protein